MPWTLITNLATLVVRFFLDRQAKVSKAEKEIARLVGEMDKLAKKQAWLKLEYDRLEKKLMLESDASLVAKR